MYVGMYVRTYTHTRTYVLTSVALHYEETQTEAAEEGL